LRKRKNFWLEGGRRKNLSKGRTRIRRGNIYNKTEPYHWGLCRTGKKLEGEGAFMEGQNLLVARLRKEKG